MRFGIINRKGKLILPAVVEHQRQAEMLRDSLSRFGSITWFEGLRSYRLHKDGRKTDRRNGPYQKLMVRYDEVRCTSINPIAVRKDGKWGFCDAEGRMVVPNRYEKVECFRNGLAKVWRSDLGDRYFYIDPEGREYLCKTEKNN